ncbi:uncharacterized membrane-anchored protein YitT (DUF2179 family) [Dysgonomonadaceae bacterium PH5-43]|nr:uncharacterized membrane-anchored protein YitT (DUF2179 family) [Dysgonomonadaceae bacterium PH5-43]
MKRGELIQEVKDYAFVLLGLLLYVIGVTGFFLPSEITTGGLTGVTALIFYATDIPVWISYLSINTVLLLFSIKIFGFKFSLKTIINVVILTLLLSVFQSLITEPIVQGEPFMSCILGGVLCGTGLGLVLNFKGSTGGTDIIALIISKHSNMSIGRAFLLCDVLIICSSYFIFQSVEKIVYGLVTMAVMSYVIDLVLEGAKQSVQFFIFSSKYDEIADAIFKEIDRGCTILEGTGWYTKKNVKIVMVIARRTESTTIFRIIDRIDPKAFISQGSVRGVYGEGFQKIKS